VLADGKESGDMDIATTPSLFCGQTLYCELQASDVRSVTFANVENSHFPPGIPLELATSS
jgi:hypothetical protein